MKIYTLEEFAKGLIPRKEDSREALDEFENECIIPFIGDSIYGGFGYGSVPRNDHNEASDLDYIVVITKEDHRKIIFKGTRKAFLQRNVSFNPNVIERDLAEAGYHTIDASFRQHLELSSIKYGYYGQNPFDILASNYKSFESSLKTSMSVYLMRLSNSRSTYLSSEEEYVKFLKTIMEKPYHAMRVTIQFFCGTVAPQGIENFSDTKDELIKLYSGLNLNPSLLENIEILNMVAEEYINLLNERQKGDISTSSIENEYRRMLKKIEGCYDASYNFIKQNALRMKK